LSGIARDFRETERRLLGRDFGYPEKVTMQKEKLIGTDDGQSYRHLATFNVIQSETAA
jgi:hypothetical protein